MRKGRRRLRLDPSAAETQVRGAHGTRPAGFRVITGYQRAWLCKDVVAGLVLTTLLVPQGMAYAELAGLPPITGLYTSIICLLAYAVFGPSRILVLGPDSVARADDRRDDPAAGGGRRAIRSGRSRWRRVLALMVGAIMVVAAWPGSASSPTCCPGRPWSAT